MPAIPAPCIVGFHCRRLVPPAPASTVEKAMQLRDRRHGSRRLHRKLSPTISGGSAFFTVICRALLKSRHAFRGKLPPTNSRILLGRQRWSPPPQTSPCGRSGPGNKRRTAHSRRGHEQYRQGSAGKSVTLVDVACSGRACRRAYMARPAYSSLPAVGPFHCSARSLAQPSDGSGR